MRYAQLRKMDISNGLGVGVALFVQGCHFHCKNCFNPETWDFNGGKELTAEVVDTILNLIEPEYIMRFSVLGGEALEPQNFFELAKLIHLVKWKKPSIKIWVYTGFVYEDLLRQDDLYLEYILDNIDVLVDGPFQEDKKDLTYPFAGSTNQRVIDMVQTREQGNVVLLKR